MEDQMFETGVNKIRSRHFATRRNIQSRHSSWLGCEALFFGPE